MVRADEEKIDFPFDNQTRYTCSIMRLNIIYTWSRYFVVPTGIFISCCVRQPRDRRAPGDAHQSIVMGEHQLNYIS